MDRESSQPGISSQSNDLARGSLPDAKNFAREGRDIPDGMKRELEPLELTPDELKTLAERIWRTVDQYVSERSSTKSPEAAPTPEEKKPSPGSEKELSPKSKLLKDESESEPVVEKYIPKPEEFTPVELDQQALERALFSARGPDEGEAKIRSGRFDANNLKYLESQAKRAKENITDSLRGSDKPRSVEENALAEVLARTDFYKKGIWNYDDGREWLSKMRSEIGQAKEERARANAEQQTQTEEYNRKVEALRALLKDDVAREKYIDFFENNPELRSTQELNDCVRQYLQQVQEATGGQASFDSLLEIWKKIEVTPEALLAKSSLSEVQNSNIDQLVERWTETSKPGHVIRYHLPACIFRVFRESQANPNTRESYTQFLKTLREKWGVEVESNTLVGQKFNGDIHDPGGESHDAKYSRNVVTGVSRPLIKRFKKDTQTYEIINKALVIVNNV